MRFENFRVEFAKKILSSRKSLNLSQIAVAKKLKMSAQFYGNIEKGKVHCPQRKLKILIKKLKIDRKDFEAILQNCVEAEVGKLFSRK